MEFPSPEISAYLYDLTPTRSEVMKEMEDLAEERQFPAVGPLVGRFLFQLVRMAKVKTILELGSGFGYSAMWLAMALPEDGQILCTEYDRENAEWGSKFLDRAQLRNKVIYEVGDALETLHRYSGPYDMIFCDLNKEQYPRALEMGIPRLKSGGLFVADNVLWSGKILDPMDQTPATRGIREFNKNIYQFPNLFSTVIPLRDGVSVSLKV